jgi:tetratricopeptide (TPR) repeat protein
MRQVQKVFLGVVLLLCPVWASGANRVVRLAVNGAERPIELRQLDIHADIAGRLAQTTVEMTFYNPNQRVLEGELQFPLLAGQTVTGFALEMDDGRKKTMRDAVPVEKAKGRQTFESVIRQRIDPALLEVTQGDNFKMRIYPLNSGQTRRVRVIYTERLSQEAGATSAAYRLPLAYADKVDQFSLFIRIARASQTPTVKGGAPEKLPFKKENGSFTAASALENVLLPGNILELSVPVSSSETAYLGKRDGKTYFYAEVPIASAPPLTTRRLSPKSLTILWDASASRAKANHARELAFLDAFFSETKNIAVTLQKIRNTTEPVETFMVRDGDWTALHKVLASTVYDGATSISSAAPTQTDLFFLFSDGLDNYSTTPLTLPDAPLFAFVSAPGADTSRLKGWANRSGGALIDLLLLDDQSVLAGIGQPPVRVLSVTGSGVSDVIWTPPTAANPTLSIAGVLKNPSHPLRAVLVGADGKRIEKEIPANFDGLPDSDLIPLAWASMKVELLEEEYDLHRGEIRRLGKTFRIATRETSLIVLDRVEDYVRYDIEPPSELKESFDRLIAQTVQRRNTGKLEQVAAKWREREEWWKKDFPKDKRGSAVTIHGTVMDASRRVLSGASITAVNIDTGVETRVTTNNAGVYIFPSLQPGTYNIVAKATGFRMATTTNVRVRLDAINLNFNMVVAGGSEKVEVIGTAENMDLVAASSTGTVIQEDMTNLPIINSNVHDLINIMGGVVQTENPLFDANDATFAGGAINIPRDGISVNEIRYNSGIAPSVGAASSTNVTAATNANTKAEISIALRPWTPDAPYSRRMKNAKSEDIYAIYLDERADYENSVAFYLDVADQLWERGQKELSLRVLSNLAEMNLENRQILRVLGYRLLEAEMPDQAVLIFEKVLDLSEDEPQSYRDLGLAYAAAGNRQKAIDRLYDVVENDFERAFSGIEIIALTEMNAIIAQGDDKIDTRRIDPRFLSNRPLDLRVVLTWDTNDTDIDLHVIDPNGEEAFYSHPLSYQGGRVSLDNTAGYGPEEYALKLAMPGKYRVEVKFYGHRQQLLSEATTIQLVFFTRYGTKEQKKQSVTMRLKEAKDRILVGEFEVK